MGEKKNKRIVEEKDELNLKRKVEVSDSADQEVKKKKKKKDKHIADDVKVHTEVDVNFDSSNDVVVKKKPYFRDKGEKVAEDGDKVEKSKSNSKFSITLPVNDSVTAPELSGLKSSGKGPKIVIATQDKKIENKKVEGKKKLSKRKRKHINAGGTVSEDSVHESKGMGKALRYLKTWSEERDSWKFEKCRQIWLLNNAYDESKVSEEVFPSLLSYMASIKGGMRQGAKDTAKEKVVKGIQWEEQSEEKVDDELQKDFGDKLSDVELRRAKQILEIFS